MMKDLHLLPSKSIESWLKYTQTEGFALLFLVAELESHEHFEYSVPLDFTFSAVVPSYCICRGFFNLYCNFKNNEMCNKAVVKDFCKGKNPNYSLLKACCTDQCVTNCIRWEENFFSWNTPGIGKQLTFLALQFIFFIITLFLLEASVFYGQFLKSKKRLKEHANYVDEFSEGDQRETLGMESSSLTELFTTNSLTVRQLSKYYGSHLAIDRLSFGVLKEECFGLLGPDKAGKSTVLKMISGEEAISLGDVYIDGINISEKPRTVKQKFGICPGLDALHKYMTGKETLTLYANLRGVPTDIIPKSIDGLNFILSMDDCMEKLVREYSFSCKRKLGIAVALIGMPPLILLDEPTAGLDPVSCRHIWNALQQALQMGHTMFLTTQSLGDDSHNSDHFPIFVAFTREGINTVLRPSRFIFERAG
ncbi:ATP-binding cassette sub-family A member 3, partial [Stegodyphus mimosarum]